MARLAPHFGAICFAGSLVAASAVRSSYEFAGALGVDAGAVSIFGPGGPKYTDVAQGGLGTCYFLAAIVSIAHKHPQMIQRMFVKRELWSGTKPVYTTQWLLDGMGVAVAVDGHVPADEASHQPFFVNVNDGADFWPVILEKAWAKIFGSFNAVSGGSAHEVFKAITQAPVEVLSMKSPDVDSAAVWSKLKEANRQAANFPVAASVVAKNKYNLPHPHAYTILEVSDDHNGHGQGVRINNPWGTKNRYCGSIPNPDHKQGSFWMTFGEFVDAFSEVTIARLQGDYSVTAAPIPTGPENTTTVLEFEVHDDAPFAVQLEWPAGRYAPDCPVLSPIFAMGVARADDLGSAVFAKKSSTFTSNARADLKGKGKYVAFVNMKFPNGAWLKNVVVNVYAAGRTTISKRDQDPWAVFFKMTGLCKRVSVQGAGKYVGFAGTYALNDKFVHGFPTLQAADSHTHPQMQLIYYSPDVLEITRAGGKVTSSLRRGTGWQVATDLDMAARHSYFPGKLKQVVCAESSLLQAVGDEAPSAPDGPEVGLVYIPSEPDVVTEEVQEHTWQSKMATTDSDVAALEPRAYCDLAVSNIPRLGNWGDIQKGDDPLFPAALRSIGKAGDSCGDDSTGRADSCDKYDHWEDISKIERHLQEKALEQQKTTKCLSAEVAHGNCTVVNSCSFQAVLHGLAPSYNTRVTLRSGARSRFTGLLAYCEVLADMGGRVAGFVPPDPCAQGA